MSFAFSNTQRWIMMLVGLPGSGKSTYVKTLLRNHPSIANVISFDECLNTIAKEHKLTYNEALEKEEYRLLAQETSWKKFLLSMADNKSIIIDRTNLSTISRARFLSIIPAHYNRICISFENVPDTIIHERLDKRGRMTGKFIPLIELEKLMKNFDEPTEEEFDYIHHM